MRKLFIFAILLVGVQQIQAQGVKIGYIHSDTVLISMSEYAAASSKIETHSNELTSQLESKQAEFQEKYADFQQNADQWNETVVADKQSDLQRLDQNIREFQQLAQTNLRNKEEEVMGPLYIKIEAAIKDVADTEGYDYVTTRQVYLYANEKHNLTNKVIAKLGGTKPSN